MVSYVCLILIGQIFTKPQQFKEKIHLNILFGELIKTFKHEMINDND